MTVAGVARDGFHPATLIANPVEVASCEDASFVIPRNEGTIAVAGCGDGLVGVNSGGEVTTGTTGAVEGTVGVMVEEQAVTSRIGTSNRPILVLPTGATVIPLPLVWLTLLPAAPPGLSVPRPGCARRGERCG